jgi:hypothetical protein
VRRSANMDIPNYRRLPRTKLRGDLQDEARHLRGEFDRLGAPAR